MDKPAKILLAGVLCAGLIVSVRVVANLRLENHVKQIRAECIEEGKREIDQGNLQCDAEVLVQRAREKDLLPQLRGGDIFDQLGFESKYPKAKNVQEKLAFAYNEFQEKKANSWLYLIAVLVVGISTLPWLWYFLLRRIRELRDAVVGN